jgi:hypothetical protein
VFSKCLVHQHWNSFPHRARIHSRNLFCIKQDHYPVKDFSDITMYQLDASYVDEVAREGFSILENFVDHPTMASVIQDLEAARIVSHRKQRGGLTFGLRDLLNAVPSTRTLANSTPLKSIVEQTIGSDARVVRAIYFDKHKNANWKVAWHQDLTIAVRERVDVQGFPPWSIKAGITHVQPPMSVLENMLALRIHLDHADETNGALRVIPGTHLHGRLDAQQIQYWKTKEITVTCSVSTGGVVVMRPLLLHSSLPSLNPEHRRVLHFEYASRFARRARMVRVKSQKGTEVAKATGSTSELSFDLLRFHRFCFCASW